MSSDAGYVYDASGLLAGVQLPDEQRWTFWQAGIAVNEVRTTSGSGVQVTWLRAAGIPCAERAIASELRTTLLGAQRQGSVVLEVDAQRQVASYAPHGQRSVARSKAEVTGALGYNGEILDATSGCYLLGPGHHRPYSPALGLFLAPDRASPFGRGGLNPLAYCGGDPINRTDPSGHFWKWIIAGVSLAVSAVAVALTAGAALGVMVGAVALTKSTAAAVAATTLGVAGIGTEVAALTAHEMGADKAGSILGWVGLGLGVAGLTAAVGKAAIKGASRLADKAVRMGQRLGRVGASAPPARTSSGIGGLSREGGRLWRADPTLGRFLVKPASASPAKWKMSAGVRPNRFSAPAQRPASLDFASRRVRPYGDELSLASPRGSLSPGARGAPIDDVAFTPKPDYPRVGFSDVIQYQDYSPVEYSSRFLRQTRLKGPADPAHVAELMASTDPDDYYIKVALMMKTP